jgi:excisionase family DNA binding protein
MNELLTVEQAADELGVTTRRVRALIAAERLPARKIGRDWLVQRSDLEPVRQRKPGRPRKEPE